MRWICTGLMAMAIPAAAQPVVKSVDPQGVRAGGVFVVQLDTSSFAGSIVLIVERERPPALQKHISKLLHDGGPGDDAPQKGLIKYRIKTDDSWLSSFDLRHLAQAEERYKIAVIQIAVPVVANPNPQLTPIPITKTNPGTQPSLQALDFAKVITVLGHAGPLDEAAVINGDLNGLLQTAVSLRLLLDPSIEPFDFTSHTYAIKTQETSAVEFPVGWIAKHKTKDTMWADAMGSKEPLYYTMDPSVWDFQDGVVDFGTTKRAITMQHGQLLNATNTIDSLLTPEQRKLYGPKLTLLRQQLDVIGKMSPK